MRPKPFITSLACAVLFSLPTVLLAQTQPAPSLAASTPLPLIAPSIPPSYVVDLMTAQGSAVFGAQWKTMEAKIIQVAPIPSALPGYKIGYDIDPHAGEGGYDDSSWPVIEAKDLSAR